jgi:uncharacterized damage-inducible protein DinB
MSVVAVYEGWRRVQDRLVTRLPELASEQLGLRATAESWPVWAIVGHVAMVRVYWLCIVCGEPGVETTPFRDPANDGWEDHLDEPRDSGELLRAVQTSWSIVESCLERWAPDELDVAFTRRRDGEIQRHTRQSVLTRLLMHDSFHSGEISLLLGEHGLPSLDPWET